ncbi:hypothetical protein ElyMa_000371600 [Elysia marginata]|uniref:Fibronectin type-III domain-containing protein n=1 Tax=Elysia marginata TaxID=1093978 RepID=A0AAV4FIH2_9GAST|nr:hypothetical protein ElyMa_000371600 [Elysia marginata]
MFPCYFIVTLFDDNNTSKGTAFRRKDDRSMVLDNLTPNTKYSAVLKTIVYGTTSVDEDTVEVLTEKPDVMSEDSESLLHVDITEIRGDRARLNMRVTGPLSDDIITYSVIVNEIDDQGQKNNTHTEDVAPADETFFDIQNLQPER